MLHTILTLGLAVAAQAGNPREGQALFARSCANCHFVPDSTIQRDKIWTQLVNTTAWSTAPGDGPSSAPRKNLIAYLTSAETKPAPRVDAASKAKDGDGTVTVPFDAGAVLLVPAEHGSSLRPVRLVFAKKGEALPVAAGKYHVKNYTIEAQHKGDYWALSGSGMHGRPVEIAAGKAASLEIDPRVHLTTRAVRHGRNIMVQLGIQGDSHMGLSVIHTNDRVKPTFALVDGSGKSLADGGLTYGWGGGAAAQVGLPDSARQAVVTIDTGPFDFAGAKSAEITSKR